MAGPRPGARAWLTAGPAWRSGAGHRRFRGARAVLGHLGGPDPGDRLADLAGPARLVRLSAGMAAAGFAAVLVGQVWSALAGFALLGAGLSVVVPLVFPAAAATGRPGPNLAWSPRPVASEC